MKDTLEQHNTSTCAACMCSITVIVRSQRIMRNYTSAYLHYNLDLDWIEFDLIWFDLN